MRLFRKMRQDKPLPVARKLTFRHITCKVQTTAAFGRLKNQMHLAVMPKRLVMTHALDGIGDGFAV